VILGSDENNPPTDSALVPGAGESPLVKLLRDQMAESTMISNRYLARARRRPWRKTLSRRSALSFINASTVLYRALQKVRSVFGKVLYRTIASIIPAKVGTKGVDGWEAVFGSLPWNFQVFDAELLANSTNCAFQ